MNDPAGHEAMALRPIGYVSSPLKSRVEAPRQGDEGAPGARIRILPEYATGIAELEPGMDVLVLTWLHEADRSVLRTIPRGDPSIPEHGVFSTRSPDRPNPIGLHRVKLLTITGTDLEVAPLEAIDSTPVIDIKPVLDPTSEK